MTIDELIQQLKEMELPGDTVVHLADTDYGLLGECEEVLLMKIGEIDNYVTVVSLW